MLNSVQTSNYSNRQYANLSNKKIATNKIQNYKPEITKNKAVSAGVATASVIGLLFTRAKLGKVLKEIGENVPHTISGRIKKMLECSTIDAMTQLGNKKNLTVNVIKDYTSAIKKNEKFGIAMFDMDNFKGINEEFGHDVGDTFLKRISANINEVIQKSGGKAYRYGGEEFVITKCGNDIDMKKISEEIAEKIKNDSQIQAYLPVFQKKAKSEIIKLTSNTKEINDLFAELKTGKDVETKKLVDVFNQYIESFDKRNSKGFKALVEKLNMENPETVSKNILDMQITPTTTMSDELNNIAMQYKYQCCDLAKWTHHIDVHQKFTISGGYSCLDGKNGYSPKDSISLVNIVDNALQASKLKGKNMCSEASSNMIQ